MGLEWGTEGDGQVAMVQVDLAKAFDRVNHSFLFSILNHINIGSQLLKGIKIRYANGSTRLIVNGSLSDPIRLLSSVRQGCPLSPLLFCLYLEPLCMSILKEQKFQGFKLPSYEIRVLAYADDVAFFCRDKMSVRTALAITKIFVRLLEPVLTLKKAQAFGVGYGPQRRHTMQELSGKKTYAI